MLSVSLSLLSCASFLFRCRLYTSQDNYKSLYLSLLSVVGCVLCPCRLFFEFVASRSGGILLLVVRFHRYWNLNQTLLNCRFKTDFAFREKSKKSKTEKKHHTSHHNNKQHFDHEDPCSSSSAGVSAATADCFNGKLSSLLSAGETTSSSFLYS